MKNKFKLQSEISQFDRIFILCNEHELTKDLQKVELKILFHNDLSLLLKIPHNLKTKEEFLNYIEFISNGNLKSIVGD